MKKNLFTLLAAIVLTGCTAVPVKADTIVIRQPGLVEGLGQAVVGTVRCVGEMATGLVAGSTTVVQTPNYVAPAVAAPVATAPVAVAQPVVAAPVVPAAPVVVAPATPLVPYGGYYTPGYRHYYGVYPGYHRPYYRPYPRYNPYLGGGHWGGLRPCPMW